MFSALSAFAVEGDEETYPDETYTEEVSEEETYYETEETYEPEETYVEEETYEPEETYVEEETYEVYEETEAPEEAETYAVLDNNLEDLPEADTSPTPTAPRTKKAENADMTYGIISWACVIVGVLTVIIVILSNKSGYYGGSGKQRYDEGNKITGQKRLLNDDYYTTRKYNDYRDRDNYR